MLTIKNVSKTFAPGTVNARLAIDGLSLDAARGDFITIIGSNGAGKSTLFNIITGSVLPDSGRITLGGKDITFTPVHKRAKEIGCLFQDPLRGTAPDMTIEENLSLAAHRGGWFGTITKTDRALFRERLTDLDMGLEDRMGHAVGLLSGGQRQALTLLMATIDPPKLLLLDEHTAALDPGAAEKVLSLTQKVVAEYGLTCLMITHNMQSALQMGNRTLMMDAGRIVLDVSGEERNRLTPDDLTAMFRERTGKGLSDRTMLG